MAVADNRYSRFVQFAKVLLPLLALGLLSTMFLFSRSVDIDSAIPISDVDPAEIAREQRLAAPKFSGVTSDGSMISVKADSAKPDLQNPRRMSAERVTADIVTQSGTEFMVVSNNAEYDGDGNTLNLMGQVKVTTSTGYELNTETLIADLAQTGLISPGMVTGAGPAGQLEAGQMELKREGQSQVLVFKGGVKLIYQPQN